MAITALRLASVLFLWSTIYPQRPHLAELGIFCTVDVGPDWIPPLSLFTQFGHAVTSLAPNSHDIFPNGTDSGNPQPSSSPIFPAYRDAPPDGIRDLTFAEETNCGDLRSRP